MYWLVGIFVGGLVIAIAAAYICEDLEELTDLEDTDYGC